MKRRFVAALAKLAAHGIRFKVDELLSEPEQADVSRRVFDLKLGGLALREAITAACESLSPNSAEETLTDDAEAAGEDPVNILEWLGVPLQINHEAALVTEANNSPALAEAEVGALTAVTPPLEASAGLTDDPQALRSLVGRLIRDEDQRIVQVESRYQTITQNLNRLRLAPAQGGLGYGCETGRTPKINSPSPKPPGVIFDEHELLAFAQGRVADIFGPEFAPVDAMPVRVRLPAPPYFFVSRVTTARSQNRRLRTGQPDDRVRYPQRCLVSGGRRYATGRRRRGGTVRSAADRLSGHRLP